MVKAFKVTGELLDSQHLKLDEPVPFPVGKVRIIIESLADEQPRDLRAFEKELRARQAARGHVPPTKEEIDSYLNAERDSWDQ